MPETTTPIHCPIRSIYDIVPCEPEEVDPLLRHLRENLPVAGSQAFPRGTVLEDGRLDLCKQSLGPENCRRITDALTDNTTVRSLLLGTDGIGDGGAKDVAALMEQNPHLEIVYLGCNRITEAGTADLCAALGHNETVKGLWLKRNPIGLTGAKHIAAMLRRNTTLQTLDLVNTDIGAEGLAAVLDALIEENRTLKRLYLGGNAIEATSAERLALLLRANPALTALLFNVNNLGDAGTIALAEGLSANTTLLELGLASCGITATGAKLLWEAMRIHPALQILDLGFSPSTRVLGASNNTLGDSGADDVAVLLEANTPLRRLDLNKTGIRLTGQNRIADSIQQNTHLVDLRLDGKLSPNVTARLNENRAAIGLPPHVPFTVATDTVLIRSVYRTAS